MADILIGFVILLIGGAEESLKLVCRSSRVTGVVRRFGKKNIAESEDALISRCRVCHCWVSQGEILAGNDRCSTPRGV